MTTPQPIWLGRHLLRPESGRRAKPEARRRARRRDVHQLRSCVLAECAVDDDFSQSGLEDGEFVVVEPLDE
jgi:hypothetical protein